MNNDPFSSRDQKEGIELLQIYDDLEWDSKLQQSRQYSIYLTSNFLKWTGLEKYRYFLYVSGRPALGCLLPPKNIDGMSALSFCMYQGIFFIEDLKDTYSDDIQRTLKLSKLISVIFDTAPHVHLALHHSISDIRGLEWNTSKKGINMNLQYKVRYTGLINLQGFSDFEKYKKTIRKVRLQEYLTASQTDGVILSAQPNVNLFLEMYKSMFIQRGINLQDSELRRVFAIIKYGISSGVGNLLMLETNDGTPICGVFTLSDKNTDYYQFGASNPDRLKLKGSSYLILRSIELAIENGRKYFDMVGMNSPNRGDFKASFNARVEPYFEVELKNTILGD